MDEVCTVKADAAAILDKGSAMCEITETGFTLGGLGGREVLEERAEDLQNKPAYREHR